MEARTKAKNLARVKRDFDSGRLDLWVLGLSLFLCALLVWAELAGLDGLCPTASDELVFTLTTGLCCAGLSLAFALRHRHSFQYPLWAGVASCLFLLIYFPLTPVSWMAILLFAALPTSLYYPAPRGFLLVAAELCLACALRFAILPPEALGQRAPSFRDILAFVAVPLAASAMVSGLAAFREENRRLDEALLAVTKGPFKSEVRKAA